MEVIFQKNILDEATSAGRGIASEISTLPLLSNVLIVAEENDNKATLFASNNEAFVKCEIPAEVKTPGAITIPALKFNQIIQELPEAEVNFKYDGKNVIITCLENYYRLAILPPQDFPSLPEMEPLTVFEVPQISLKKAIDYLLFSIAVSDPRKIFLGGLFDLKGNILKTVSTDGRKLSYCEIDVPEVSGQSITKAIIPNKVLSEVQKYLKNEGAAKVVLAKKRVSFSFGNLTYISNLIEGSYPNYEPVIPKEFIAEIVFDRDVFDYGLRRAAILTDERTYGVIMRFTENKVEMQANIYDLGSFDGYLPVQFSGEQFIIAFSYRTFHDVLRLFDSGEILLKIKGVEAPALIREKKQERKFFLIMPIKLSEMPTMVNVDETKSEEEQASPEKWEDKKEDVGENEKREEEIGEKGVKEEEKENEDKSGEKGDVKTEEDIKAEDTKKKDSGEEIKPEVEKKPKRASKKDEPKKVRGKKKQE